MSDSLARARLACGCDDCLHSPNVTAHLKRIATVIDEARLEEAKWWRTNFVMIADRDYMKWIDSRIEKLETSLRERGRV